VRRWETTPKERKGENDFVMRNARSTFWGVVQKKGKNAARNRVDLYLEKFGEKKARRETRRLLVKY